MKTQVWFQTNLAYEVTRNQLRGFKQTIVGDMQGYGGKLTFHLKDFKDVTFQITTNAKLSITYPEEFRYEDFLKHVKPLLVKADGTPAEITKIISERNSVVKIEEADREEVERCTKAISKALKDGNKDSLSSRVDQLKQLSERNRIAHFSQVLPTIEKCLESPILAYGSETFRKLVDTLSDILFNEQYYKTPNGDKIVERIQNKTSPKAISLVRENPEFPHHSIIWFLGKCGTKEAVETIFEKIKSKPVEARKSGDTAHALAKLYSKHGELIDQQFDALMEEKNPKLVVEAATKLRHEMNHKLPIHL